MNLFLVNRLMPVLVLLGTLSLASRAEAQAATQPATRPGDARKTLVAPIEAAHGMDAWKNHRAIQADIRITFGGGERFNGSMTFAYHQGKVRMHDNDGTVMTFDGQKAWVSPPDGAAPPGARFHLLTWSYFLAAPFKLSDPGTHVQNLVDLPLQGEPQPAARLTFGENVGDTPDDWYILFHDPETDQLEGMSYIVTYGQAAEKAEKEPHAVVYHDYVEVDGTQLSTRWIFWKWSAKKGTYGDSLGEVTLENLKFVEPEPELFEKPEGAVEDKLPEMNR